MKFEINKLKEYIKPSYEFEVFIQKTKKNKISVYDEKVDSLTSSEEIGIGLRIKKGNRVSFVSSTLNSQDTLKELVEKGMEICDVMPEEPFVDFVRGKMPAGAESVFDEEALSLSLKDKESIPIELERICKKIDSRIVGVRESSFTETLTEVEYYNSYGVEFGYRGTFYTVIVGALATEKSDSNISYEYRGVRRIKDINIEDIARDVTFKATEALNPKQIEAKTVPVVFYRESFAMLINTFSEIFLGSSLIKGKTFLKDLEGERVFGELITIIDDGTLKDGFSTSPYDDEGIPTQKTILVEKGVFKGFLHNIYTANKSNSAPTGNGVREGYNVEPDVGITNLYIKEGDKTLEEMIDGYEEVVLALDLMGLHTSDPISGEFSLGISGVLYNKGKKKHGLRGITVAGNIKDILNKVEAVGNDIKFYGSVGSPSILIKEVTVGGN